MYFVFLCDQIPLYDICVITVWEGDSMAVDNGSVQIVASELRKNVLLDSVLNPSVLLGDAVC